MVEYDSIMREQTGMTRSSVIKRSIVVHGRKTSVSVENSFWHALKEVAQLNRKTLADFVSAIERDRPEGSNLSSAIRVHVLSHYRTMVEKLTRRGTVPELASSADRTDRQAPL